MAAAGQVTDVAELASLPRLHPAPIRTPCTKMTTFDLLSYAAQTTRDASTIAVGAQHTPHPTQPAAGGHHQRQDVTPVSARPDAGKPTPLAGALAEMLGRLGVRPSDERTVAENAVTDVLAERGHQATIVELRWGCLTLEASPAATRLLRLDVDVISGLLAERIPGEVSEIHIRTRT